MAMAQKKGRKYTRPATPRQSQILTYVRDYIHENGYSPTLQEIGDRLHLSRERVRQIESRAKEKLRCSAKLRSHLN